MQLILLHLPSYTCDSLATVLAVPVLVDWQRSVNVTFALLASSIDLVVVEYDVGIQILARNGVRPQFLHEKDLISKLRYCPVPCGPRFPDPVGQMTNEIEKEVSFRDADDLIGDFDEETEPFGGSEV